MKSLMGSIQEGKIKPLVDPTKFEVRFTVQILRYFLIRWTHGGAWLGYVMCLRTLRQYETLTSPLFLYSIKETT